MDFAWSLGCPRWHTTATATDHGCAVVSLAARADIADGARFRQLLKLPEAQGPGRIIVDLSRLSSIDWWAALIQRRRIVLGCADGKTSQEVSAELGIWPQSVGKWRRRLRTASGRTGR